MKRLRNRIVAVTAVGALALVGAACANNDDTVEQPGQVETESTTTGDTGTTAGTTDENSPSDQMTDETSDTTTESPSEDMTESTTG